MSNTLSGHWPPAEEEEEEEEAETRLGQTNAVDLRRPRRLLSLPFGGPIK